MVKTYKSNSSISINVVLSNKKNLHVSFIPSSSGISTFTTGDENIQKAIENHSSFRKLFRLAGTKGTDAELLIPAGTKGTDAEHLIPAESGGNIDPYEDAAEGSKEGSRQRMKAVKISDIATAKDYLADTFGISRTAMRSTKQILEKASEYGIVFEGI
jgi:hypothetical protein